MMIVSVSTLSADVVAKLSRWINAQYLTPDGIAAIKNTFTDRPERYVVLDDVMDSARLDQIRALVLRDGNMQSHYKLYSENSWVEQNRFEQAPDQEQFIFEEIYTSHRPDLAMSQTVLHDVLFRNFVGSPPFAEWLSAITGFEVGAVQNINLKRLGVEHFLRWHSDKSPGRVLCMTLYLHQGWQQAYGGHLLMCRADGNGADQIEPLFNRMVLFNPNSKSQHAVEPLTPAAEGWSRINYSIWFMQRQAA